MSMSEAVYLGIVGLIVICLLAVGVFRLFKAPKLNQKVIKMMETNILEAASILTQVEESFDKAVKMRDQNIALVENTKESFIRGEIDFSLISAAENLLEETEFILKRVTDNRLVVSGLLDEATKHLMNYEKKSV